MIRKNVVQSFFPKNRGSKIKEKGWRLQGGSKYKTVVIRNQKEEG
jgi:hypothetical protein